jgi:DNA-binding transcriptional MerR regulator
MTASRNQAEKRLEKSEAAFRSIGEAAGELGLEAHVIRYWETRFPRDVKPVKRPDGRRLFRPEDMDALRAIHSLVHQHGLTLKAAKTVLDAQGVEAVLAGNAQIDTPQVAPAQTARALQSQLAQSFGAPAPRPGAERRERLAAMIGPLTLLKARLDRAIDAVPAR